MTREEILNMNPGRDLDALVAEKVMGWERTQYGWDNPELKYNLGIEWNLPHYSTNISDAWQVVEKVLSVNKNWHFNLVVDVDGCSAAFNDKEDIYKEILGVGETAPEAICKAGLLSVMEV